MGQTQYRTFAGEIVGQREQAILFAPSERSDREDLGLGVSDCKWVPRSVCRDGGGLDVGDSDVEIATWWVNKQLA